ncbi:T9SS sorting signal type C domain-containing protein [Flavobacterium yafengii]|uniref:T9SS sorting signal type C domain-containing protein n=1 Tax=Flavobacterium yafengii TaxID=3041253 RepID=UPI0024A9C31B|nr:T9SS sorting signal type C domain-containing protein [Flavobacterium yafengii]MDI5897923.1 T9SS sorting signal type C domain-containing protein [Flavobacterium yafengii]
MIKKLLFTFFLVLVQTIISAQTNTYIGTNNSWTTAANWSLGIVPTASHDVVIQSGKSVNISLDSFAKSLNISGTLTISTGKRLTVSGDFTVNTGGTFSMGSGSDSSTLIVYGNYTNNGTTNFYKSDVIIVGDLLSPATSGLQNQGNVIVGGNIIGGFDLTGGTGTSQIYAVNPNAIVTITPMSIDTNVTPGVQVTSESTALIALVNTVIYGGNCTFTISSLLNQSNCLGAAIFSVTTNAASDYTAKWQVNSSGNTWNDLSDDSVYSGTNTLSLTINTVSSVMNSYKYRIVITKDSCSKYSNVATFKNTTWDGTSWSNGTPVGGSNIVFTGSYPPAIDPAIDLSGCSCQITGSANVTIKSGRTLTVVNELNILGSASLTFENNASLVQTNDATSNSGNITYKRLTTPIKKFDYTYWSSPVSPQTLYNVSPTTLSDKFFSFDSASEDWKQESSSTTMSKGKGYIIRAPENNSITPPPPGLYEAVFIGAPNNGTVSISSLINDSSYLIGNPYPSALDANKFLIDNSTVLDGTLYFWTHNTSIQLASSITNGSAGSGAYAYTSDDYATYNLTGGVGTSATTIGFGPVVPTGKIASGQAFFASTKPTIPANSSIMFNNSMRVEGTILGNNSQFFRTTKSSKTASVIEKHRVWLNLTNSEGAFKQMLVGYVTDATNDYDNAFDGESFDGNEFIDFYSINEDKNLTIQGRALPFDKNDEVTLGYSSTIEGIFSISIDQVDGILTSEDVFIEDKMTNNVKNLKEGAYSFSTGAGAFNDRFVLRFTQKTLGTDKVGEFDNSVLISNDKNVLKIKSELESIKRITVFDLLGRKLFDKEAVNSNEFSTSNITLNKQLVLVKVMLTNGKVISKKVIY